MPARVAYRSPEARAVSWLTAHTKERPVAIAAAVVFLLAAFYYSFVLGEVRFGIHAWYTPVDLWLTLQSATDAAQGHFSAVYTPYQFVTLPGILVPLTPISWLISALHLVRDTPTTSYPHPNAWWLLGPFSWMASAVALFASDALAQRLGVGTVRRMLLAGALIVVLWPAAIIFGHPEDALALGLMLYGFLFAFEGRWTGAGWLLGVALAVQPLVVVAFPVMLAWSGARHWRGLLLRGAIPPVAVVLPPLVANFHQTFDTLVKQPTFPLLDHETPWTALAPRIHVVQGFGGGFGVSGGPGRVVSLVLAVGLGFMAYRWRDRPESILWLLCVALALRCFTESVMVAYYVLPAIAVALVLSAASDPARFGTTLFLGVFLTISAQWQEAWAVWWVLTTVLLAAILVTTNPRALAQTRPALVYAAPATDHQRNAAIAARKAANRQRQRAQRQARSSRR